MATHDCRGRDGRIYRTFVVETIAEHAKDHHFSAYCDECGHSKPVDMAYWIGKLGPDHMMDRFRRRFRCANCGSKDVRLIGSYIGKPKY